VDPSRSLFFDKGLTRKLPDEISTEMKMCLLERTTILDAARTKKQFRYTERLKKPMGQTQGALSVLGCVKTVKRVVYSPRYFNFPIGEENIL